MHVEHAQVGPAHSSNAEGTQPEQGNLPPDVNPPLNEPGEYHNEQTEGRADQAPAAQQTEPRDRTHFKKSRAALRVATLNMKGGGSKASNGKWRTISRLLVEKSINILVLQETHMTPARVCEIQNRYKRMRIINSADPNNPSGKGGVAIVLNKSNTKWKDVTTEVIVPGRAIDAKIEWNESAHLNLTAVYAPSGNDTANAAFWDSLKEHWARPQSTRPDVLLGDMNMTEYTNDRRPGKADNAAVVDAFREMKEANRLIDGWLAQHTGPMQYTFRTQKRGQANSRSRIDRIYVRESLEKRTYEWCILDSGIKTTDHYLAMMAITLPETPYIGKGRSTIADFMLGYNAVINAIVKRTQALVEELEKLSNGTTPRSDQVNPQTLWKAFKTDLLRIVGEYSRKRTSKINEEIALWDARKKSILARPDLDEDEDGLALLDEVECNITNLTAARVLRQQTKMEARHQLIGETNSKYDYILHREQKPRDSIPRLRVPDSNPPRYETSSNRMVEIATTHHEKLQDHYDRPATARIKELARQKALSALATKLTTAENQEMGAKITQEEVLTALGEIANGKASGLDGIPVEVWKLLNSRHKSAEEEAKKNNSQHNEPDIAKAITAVLNDIETNGISPNTDFAEGW
ncbi:Endonuclease/exonuclease/phosphatase, partial [Ephemerocybe angulata]